MGAAVGLVVQFALSGSGRAPFVPPLPLAASLVGRLYLGIGFRRTVLIGMSITTVAAGGLVLIAPWPNPLLFAAVAFVLGFGLGWTAAPTLIGAQAAVGWGERGAVTGMNGFARSAGSAVGVAVLGAISNSLLDAGEGAGGPATVVWASTWVFVGAAVFAALTLLAALLMPRDDVPDPDAV